MTHREKILQLIDRLSGAICDDCLTKQIGLSARQQAYARCTELRGAGAIGRGQGTCMVCAKTKTVNWRLGAAPMEVAATTLQGADATAPNAGRLWYWEGNVQARIVSYLLEQGYSIRRTADTASREAGKDIVAVSPGGKELWVSVKGFPTPKGSTNVQARHWFSHAVFDMVLYRGENPAVELAIGLPKGYKTYQTLAGRVQWFRQSLPFRIYWVDQSGQIEVT